MGVNPVGWEESRPQMFGWQVVWVVECRGVPLNIIISYKVQEYVIRTLSKTVII